MADDYPFVPARHFRAGRVRPVRLIVVHSAETGESAETAEAVARFFATTDRKASAHVTVDADSVVRSVRDDDTAFAAAGANADGLHVEHAGRARQTRAEWLDPYGQAMLARSAQVAARWAHAYRIPVRRLTVEQVADGETPGFTDHATVSAAFPKVSTGHYDPGPGWPWDHYLALVAAALAPEVEEDELTRFVKAKGSPAVYVTNGINRRWVQSPAKKGELERLGVPGAVQEMSLDGLNDIPLVGPDFAP